MAEELVSLEFRDAMAWIDLNRPASSATP